MLDQITPVLLTYNEEPNIARTLSNLAWAKEVIVVDSGSTDGTLEILAKFSNVRMFKRPFDTHANQWRYAVEQTDIATNWILRLDADYQLSDGLLEELAQLDPNVEANAYRISFHYAIFSRKLLSSLYPPNTILLRRGHFAIRDKGHTEAWYVNGPIATLRCRIIHDDWKSVEHWVRGQARYMRREADALQATENRVVRWLRRNPPIMPIAMFFYCLFGRGLVLNGRAGIFYALQRMVAEAVLSLMVLEQALQSQGRNLSRDERHLSR